MTATVDRQAGPIVNQLFDLLTEEISRRADDLGKYTLVDARQASNDRADQFVTKALADVRAETAAELDARFGDYLALVERIHEVYRHVVMDTDKDREIHARHIKNADNALALVRQRLGR